MKAFFLTACLISLAGALFELVHFICALVNQNLAHTIMDFLGIVVSYALASMFAYGYKNETKL